jgi:DNA-binding MarR family transcriptional regulator
MATSSRLDRQQVEAFTAGLDDFLRALRTARGRFNRAPAVPELSASQFHLLEPLATSPGPLPMYALADAADVAPPTASRMLDGLVKRGIAERTRSQDGDRRRVEIRLTAEGRKLVAAKRRRIAGAREQVFDRLSPSERRAAARLLHSLAAAIDDLHP